MDGKVYPTPIKRKFYLRSEVKSTHQYLRSLGIEAELVYDPDIRITIAEQYGFSLPPPPPVVDARVISPKKNACKIVPTEIQVGNDLTFQLGNDTEWTVLVTFLNTSGTGPADWIVADDQTVEIKSGEIRDIDVVENGSEVYSCIYVIHRDVDGSWVHCSGSGGSPELIVEPP